MNEKFSIDDFVTPLENTENTLEMLQGFYSDGRFEDMAAGEELIEKYEKTVKALKEVA